MPEVLPDATMLADPMRDVFIPVAIVIDGTWRFGVLRAWHKGLDGRWAALIEHALGDGEPGSARGWFEFRPASVRPLTLDIAGPWHSRLKPRPDA